MYYLKLYYNKRESAIILKKKIAIMLTIVFLYNTFGFLLVHPLLVNYFKHLGMKEAENPSEEMIELIVLKKQDILLNKINFERIHSREFRLNGRMYDIVKEVDKDSLVSFYCVNDKKEETLEKELHKRIDDNTANKKQRSDDNNPFKTLITEAVSYITPDKADTYELTYRNNFIWAYIPFWKDVLTPPPKSFLLS